MARFSTFGTGSAGAANAGGETGEARSCAGETGAGFVCAVFGVAGFAEVAFGVGETFWVSALLTGGLTTVGTCAVDAATAFGPVAVDSTSWSPATAS